jgi:aldehyde:ferredoxin oxidoreductase
MGRGYMGKILKVDLSKGEFRDDELDERLGRQFLGGYGIGARIIFSEQAAGVDPLGPDNILGFLTGPLTGTQAISGTRYTVAGKSPLTGGWGDANSGGYFGAYLKFSGYDAIFFTGISEKPVYLFIDNGKAELKDAAHLWGKDTYETEDVLQSELGKDTAVSCIGPSGEKLGLISCIMHNKGNAAGRSGLGAVMGSKKLKAVAVKGKMKVPVADEEGTHELRTRYLAKMGGHMDWIKKYGTSFVTLRSALTGDSPVKNWGGVAERDFPNAEPLGHELLDAFKLKPSVCYRCPVGCDAVLKEGTGEYKFAAGSARPEYETLAMLGSNCANNNLESVIMANDICNRFGLDTISAGAVMAFAMECFEKGLITAADTGGIDMNWGNHQSMVKMLQKMAVREGFGDILADGVKKAAEKIGKDAGKYAIHIHGQEVPGHNPIGSFHWSPPYVASPTPARHTQGSDGMMSELIPPFDKKSFTGRGRGYKIGCSFQNSLMSAGMCLFVLGALPSPHNMAEFLSSVTGWDIDTDEVLVIGERIANIRQAFNCREGINLLQYEIPGRIFGRPPHQEGPLKGITVDDKTMVKESLMAMDWDLETAKPTRKKLVELGLNDVAQVLWPTG